jgi:methionyl-tRNA formyltransferase
MRLVFLGTSAFAVPILQLLADRYPVIGVISQPDRPAGRGRRPRPSPVSELAFKLDLPVSQPERIRHPSALATLMEWKPDLILVAAYGQILPPAILELPPSGCLNIHASLLPRWRGAAPIQAAVLHGDSESGVSLMKMDQGMDTGPVLAQMTTPIRPQETAGELSARLSQLGAKMASRFLPDYLAGRLEPRPQDEQAATYAPLLKKTDGRIDPMLPALHLANQVRAYHPWPGSYLELPAGRLLVLSAHPLHDAREGNPGERRRHEGKPALVTGEGWLILDEVQPAGKRPMSGQAYLHGSRDF